MTDHDKEEEKDKMNIFDYIFMWSPFYDISKETLSRDLDADDWHLKYARNIVNIIFGLVIFICLNSIIFPTRNVTIDPKILFLPLVFCISLMLVCYIVDEVLDQESTFVAWFSYARFLFVVFTVGVFSLTIGIFALKTITNFSI